MKILVTGGAGFIASHLVDSLIEQGDRVVVIDDLSAGDEKNINKKAIFYRMNIGSPKVDRVFKKEKPQIVFHFASQINIQNSISHPVQDATTNILGSINMLESCKKYKVKKVIFPSTGGAIYGEASVVPTSESYPANPMSPYGLSKLAIEYYLNYYYKVFKIPFVSLRFPNVYGPRQSSKSGSGVVGIFCRQVLLGKEVSINGSGRQSRDFMYVGDAIRAGLLAMKSKKTGIFNIGTSREININALLNVIQKEAGLRVKVKRIQSKYRDQKRSCLDSLKAAKELGWKSKYSLEQGIKKTIEWHRSLEVNSK